MGCRGKVKKDGEEFALPRSFDTKRGKETEEACMKMGGLARCMSADAKS